MKLAVILVNHNHGDLIKKTINSLMASPIGFDLFLLNNVPDQALTSWVASTNPKVHLMENIVPQGFAANVNQVIRKNPGFKYYLLVNPDVTVLTGMVEILVETMKQDPKIGIAGPQLLNLDGSIQPSARRFPNLRVLIMRALHLDMLFKESALLRDYLMKDVTFSEVTEVDWIAGAVMLLRKQALDEIGLLDERFFLYFEDEDICLRMWRGGWKVCYVPNAKAFHDARSESRLRVFSKARLHHIASAIKMYWKYRGRITRNYP